MYADDAVGTEGLGWKIYTGYDNLPIDAPVWMYTRLFYFILYTSIFLYVTVPPPHPRRETAVTILQQKQPLVFFLSMTACQQGTTTPRPFSVLRPFFFLSLCYRFLNPALYKAAEESPSAFQRILPRTYNFTGTPLEDVLGASYKVCCCCCCSSTATLSKYCNCVHLRGSG